MNYLLYFRNTRRDGCVRTGVEVNRDRLFHQFVDGPDVKDVADENPAIDWFIDLLFEGKTIPTDPERVRRWLAQAGPFLRTQLDELAVEVTAGIDENSFPITQEWKRKYKDARVSCKISAVRRIRHENLASALRDLAKSWERDIKTLPVAEPDLI